MKRIQYHKYGGPETMQLENFELQAPGKGQVAVKFASINPIDWKVRNGYLRPTHEALPAVLAEFIGKYRANLERHLEANTNQQQ